jgi:hypothetical protein
MSGTDNRLLMASRFNGGKFAGVLE